MATLALVPYPEAGHLNACVGLARALIGRGHAVTLLLPRADAARLAATGLDVHALDLSLPSVEPVAHERLPLDLTLRMRTRRRVDAIFAEYARCDLGAVFAALGAALVVVDREMQSAALHALAACIPVVSYATTLSVSARDGAAPLTSSARPDGVDARLRAWLGWRVAAMRAAAVEHAGRAVGLRGWRATYARTLPRFGVPMPPDDGAPRPWLPLRELVLCPAAFDLPAVNRAVAADSRRSYGAPFIDERRADEPLPFRFAEPARPLVFCSLGSQGERAAGRGGLFASVIAATRGCNLVLSVGAAFDRSRLSPLPERVRVVGAVPQLAVLRRAALMITHGGFNSVKECVWSGVPMIVIPQGFDQPGNAVRVAWHGLGEHLPERAATVERLRGAVARLVGDEACRARVGALGARFRRAQADGSGLDFLEQAIAPVADRRSA